MAGVESQNRFGLAKTHLGNEALDNIIYTLPELPTYTSVEVQWTEDTSRLLQNAITGCQDNYEPLCTNVIFNTTIDTPQIQVMSVTNITPSSTETVGYVGLIPIYQKPEAETCDLTNADWSHIADNCPLWTDPTGKIHKNLRVFAILSKNLLQFYTLNTSDESMSASKKGFGVSKIGNIINTEIERPAYQIQLATGSLKSETTAIQTSRTQVYKDLEKLSQTAALQIQELGEEITQIFNSVPPIVKSIGGGIYQIDENFDEHYNRRPKAQQDIDELKRHQALAAKVVYLHQTIEDYSADSINPKGTRARLNEVDQNMYDYIITSLKDQYVETAMAYHNLLDENSHTAVFQHTTNIASSLADRGSIKKRRVVNTFSPDGGVTPSTHLPQPIEATKKTTQDTTYRVRKDQNITRQVAQLDRNIDILKRRIRDSKNPSELPGLQDQLYKIIEVRNDADISRQNWLTQRPANRTQTPLLLPTEHHQLVRSGGSAASVAGSVINRILGFIKRIKISPEPANETDLLDLE